MTERKILRGRIISCARQLQYVTKWDTGRMEISLGKDKRITELEEAIKEGIDNAESYGCSDWSISPLVKALKISEIQS